MADKKPLHLRVPHTLATAVRETFCRGVFQSGDVDMLVNNLLEKIADELESRCGHQELNPDHPTTQSLRQQWHKILGLVMVKGNLTSVPLTLDFIESLGKLRPQGTNVVAIDANNTITIRIVDDAEAHRLASAQ